MTANAPGYANRTPVQIPSLRRLAYQGPPLLAEDSGIAISHAPASSGRYIGSPSLALLPNGEYVASHDFFGPEANHRTKATTVIFGSKDKGASWQQRAILCPAFWGKLFVHREKLYLLGTSHEYGDAVIRRSEDGGRTWSEPHGPTTGLLRRGRYHCAPCPTLIHNGRIWRSMEAFIGGEWGSFAVLVMSAAVDAELLDAASWRFSQHLPKQQGFCWLEGNVALGPDGGVVNVLRTNQGGSDRAALVHVSANGHELSFDRNADLVDMPGGGAKFTIRYDRQTTRYWAIVNEQADPASYRNHLALTFSDDLRKWTVAASLLQHTDAEKHAWQYVDWQFEGDDIVFVSRTACEDGMGGAHSAHDANYLTFHRIKDSRCLGRGRT